MHSDSIDDVWIPAMAWHRFSEVPSRYGILIHNALPSRFCCPEYNCSPQQPRRRDDPAGCKKHEENQEETLDFPESHTTVVTAKA